MKLKYLLSIVLVFALCFGVLNLAFADQTEPVPEGYTPIYSAEDLNNIRNDLAGKYILMNDIDLSVYENWEPIGTYDNPFTGELNGNKKTIYNLKIEIISEEKIAFAALFGAVTNGRLSNIALNECNINVNAKADKIWGVCASGLVALGNRNSTIENCIVSGSISVQTDKKAYASGVASGFSGTIKNCKNLASVSVYVPNEFDCDQISVGGVVGYFSGLLEKSSNYGTIRAEYNSEELNGWVNIGGIAGYSMDGESINNCYNIGTVEEETNQILRLGGIAGYSATVSNSHNYGTLLFDDDEKNAGGITGQTEFWMESVWENGETEKYAELKNCYFLNDIINSTGVVEEELMVNVLSLTEEEFNNPENFIGFDFETIWIMNEEFGYPVLRNEPEITKNDNNNPNDNQDELSSSNDEPTYGCVLEQLQIVKIIKSIVSFLVDAIKNIYGIIISCL